MSQDTRIMSEASPNLLRVARKAGIDASVDPSAALVAIVFGAFSVESFVNELLARVREDQNLEYSKELTTLRELIAAARLEERTASLRTKVDVICVALTGRTADFGKAPLQDFGELIRLRDELAHNRPERLITEAGVTIEGHPTDIQTRLHERATFLVSRGVVATPQPDTLTALIALLHSARVAHWAHNTAVDTIRALIAMLPNDGWRARAVWGLGLGKLPVEPTAA